MSQWTHICGTIRLDNMARIFQPGFNGKRVIESVLGPMNLYDAPADDCRLPNGSEGSLQYALYVYPNNESGLYWASLVFWGDLRDFGRAEWADVPAWWEKTLDDLAAAHMLIRQAVLLANIEYVDEPIVLTDEAHRKRQEASFSQTVTDSSEKP